MKIVAAISTGVLLAILVFVIVPGTGFNELSLTRWLHILSGIMWIGLLYYVNVAQIPALAAAAADKGGPGGAGKTSTSRRAYCSGSAGPRSPPGSPAGGISGARAISSARKITLYATAS